MTARYAPADGVAPAQLAAAQAAPLAGLEIFSTAVPEDVGARGVGRASHCSGRLGVSQVADGAPPAPAKDRVLPDVAATETLASTSSLGFEETARTRPEAGSHERAAPAAPVVVTREQQAVSAVKLSGFGGGVCVCVSVWL